MLNSLFGCESVKRILLFLLINERAYAHQLKNALEMSLTPIQKALKRLEKGGILSSEKSGKTRFYRFDETCFLQDEMEALLTKAFCRLPYKERRAYFDNKEMKLHEKKEGLKLLEKVWSKLKTTSQVTLIVNSSSKNLNKWTQRGKGSVMSSFNETQLTFSEEGQWEDRMRYRNAFRWTRDRFKMILSLEHLRFGESNPVFLFHLSPSGKSCLKSLDPHVCGDDTYQGSLEFNELFLKLHIRTLGPKKNERADYIYT